MKKKIVIAITGASTPLRVREGGPAVTYSIVLTRPPEEDVRVTASPKEPLDADQAWTVVLALGVWLKVPSSIVPDMVRPATRSKSIPVTAAARRGITVLTGVAAAAESAWS